MTAEPITGPGQAGPNILIVDDSAMMRTMIKRVASIAGTADRHDLRGGQRPRGAGDPRAAPRAVRLHRPEHAGHDRHRAAARDAGPRPTGAASCASSSRPTAPIHAVTKPRTCRSRSTSRSPSARRKCAMSSPRSPQRPDGLAALGAAVRQVAEDSLFACAEPCERSRTAGLLEARPVGRAVADRGDRLQRAVRRRRPGDAAARAGRRPRRRVLRRAAAVAGRVAGRRLRRRAGQHGVRAVADADPPQRAVRAGGAGRRRRGGARRRGDGRPIRARSGSPSTIRPC